MKKLPHFLVCGAMKAGSTSFFHYLNEHPQIYMYPKKEVHFFDRDEFYAKGISFYEKKFIRAKENQIIGEVTPGYMFLRKVPGRIKENLPGAKLVFILRDPVKRAQSHYLHMIRRGLETLSFEDALAAEEERISKGEKWFRAYSYKERGKYIDQIERFAQLFPRKQLYFIILEDLHSNANEVFGHLFKFLNIDADFIPQSFYNRPKNFARIPKYPAFTRKFKNGFLNKIPNLYKLHDKFFLKEADVSVSPSTETELRNYFRPYNKRLSRFLERNNILWDE